MSDRSDDPTRQLQFLEGLVDALANVAGDILTIGVDAWAIHGTIPVDGDVLVARYESREEASHVLAQLSPNRATDDRSGP
jgi:hypothetical protein